MTLALILLTAGSAFSLSESDCSDPPILRGQPEEEAAGWSSKLLSLLIRNNPLSRSLLLSLSAEQNVFKADGRLLRGTGAALCVDAERKFAHLCLR